MKQKQKRKKEKSTSITLIIDRINRKKPNKDREDLNNTINLT